MKKLASLLVLVAMVLGFNVATAAAADLPADVQKIVIELKHKGIGVLITDHNVRETLSIVDRAYLIHQGTVLVEGSSDVILNDEKARKFYLGSGFQM